MRTRTAPHPHRHHFFVVLSAVTASAFFATVAHRVYTMDLRPLAALCLPVLAVFFTFTSLLYIRGNSIAARRSRVRTLFAAETSMQATVFYLTGVVAGASLYGLFQIAGFTFEPSQPSWSGLWLVAYALPFALMLIGILNLLRAACVVSPQLLNVTSLHEVRRRLERVRASPAH